MTQKPWNLTNSHSRALRRPCVQNSYGSYQWGPLSSGKKSSGSFSCFYQEFGHYQTKPALLPLEALRKKKRKRQTELRNYITLCSSVWKKASTLVLIWGQTAVLRAFYLSCWRCSPLLHRQPPVAQSPRLQSPGRCSSLSSAELQDWESWDWHAARDAG